jgi:hypothetical protein
MLPEYYVEPFSPESFSKMKTIFQSAYGVSPDEKAFRQKYDTKDPGREVIGFIAIHKSSGTPAAFYGVFPVYVLINAAKVLAAQSGDTMTHRDHQKKGLFVMLAQTCFEACRQKGIAFIFGLPNKNSYHGFTKKLGWEHKDDIIRYDCKLSVKTFPLPKLLLRAGLFSRYLKYSRKLLKQYVIAAPDSFINSLASEKGKVLRDHNYISYKQGTDKFFIRMEGLSLWIRLADTMWIGDIKDYENLSEKHMKQLKRLAFWLGYNTIRFHINRGEAPEQVVRHFKAAAAEPLCFYYPDPAYSGVNLLLNGADFDTW